jgi:AraC family transcriptional regulator, regulatory protein of adaptative response / methylated-DNA-[protein]-cysteine methyltransferase
MLTHENRACRTPRHPYRSFMLRMPPPPPTQAATIVECTVQSPLGPLRLGATAEGLCLLEFDDPRRLDSAHRGLDRWLGLPCVPGRNAHLDLAASELNAYFAGTLSAFTVPLVSPGTAFETRVWTALRSIPCGATWSYAQLATAIGNPRAHRAVGMANGRNRIAILIPCHRVVNTGGSLGGYGGGLQRKEWLLKHEANGTPSGREAPNAS